MNIDDAISRLNNLIQDLEEAMPLISEELAMNAQALVIFRIQQQGLQGKQYSKNKLPAYFFKGKENNAGGRKLVDRDDGDGISYYEWRRANGLQVAFVDLTFSGRMFQNQGVVGTVPRFENIGPTETVKRGEAWVTIVAGFNKETRDKLRYNAIRFGNFFALEEGERVALAEIFENRIKAIVDKNLER